ncbi:hypothetical protein V7054_05070 [Priestia megaterium]|uniref:hypothetical protein n=1 Tax=Priestia megaterium TaxID=1404 RepID=UPI002FFEC76F
MEKNYITKAYIDMLTKKEKQTGIYFSTPKVIKRGDRYRKTLSLTQKAIYEEFYDLAKKAVHKGQIDEKGRVYVEVSYSYIAVALDISVKTAEYNMNGKGNKDSKYNELFTSGLLAIKKRGKQSMHEFYVMAPVYEGADEIYLKNDGATPQAKKEIEEISAKKNSRKPTKRKKENEQLEEERIFDTVADTAEYKVEQKIQADNIPDFDEPFEEKESVPQEPQKEMYFRVIDKEDYNGTYNASFVIKHDGVIVESWTLKDFLKKTKSSINLNQHESYIIKELQKQGEYKIKYEDSFEY